ncbi:MAG: AI-2E family transporter [Hyphomicrobiales bacterium]|nr:AI-2E family transporter [Hyphomicrobiales bacterium]
MTMRDGAPAPSQDGRIRSIASRSGWIVLAGLLVAAHELRWVLLPFVIAAIFALMCRPLVRGAQTRTGLPHWLVAVFVFLVILTIAAGAAFYIAPPLAAELKDFVFDLHGAIGRVAHIALGSGTIGVFGEQMNADQIAESLANAARSAALETDRAVAFGFTVFAALFGLFLTFLLLLFFLLTGESLGEGIVWLFPPDQRWRVRSVWSRLEPALRRYFLGVLSIMVYAIVVAYIGLGLVLHIPHAFVLATATGVLELIPVIGPATSVVLAGLIAAEHSGSVAAMIGYAVYAIALRLSIDQLVAPLALGVASRFNPVVIMFGFFAGGVLFGAVGIVLAVPTAMAVRATLESLYADDEKRDAA